MKIKSIEFENFRNFRGHGQVKCATDGRVTIIYGKNGDGKTTLHQLFQWIIYGHVRFNKTTTDYLYNLAYEREQKYGAVFDVMGRLDLEHENIQYSLTRIITYKKGLDDSEKISEEMTLQMMDDDYNWKRVERPKETIEKMLPSGLSEYFFFDGESMIADLRVKGRDSAGKLRKALFSMFDLDVIEFAKGHIGRTDLKTTVLGKLYLSKGTIASGSQVAATKTNIENAQNIISGLEEKLSSAKENKTKKLELVRNISEQIGNTKSKSEYENQRRSLQKQRDVFLDNAKSEQTYFGGIIMEIFPQLLISKAVSDAKGKLHLKVEDSHLPSGVNKRLIAYLLSPSTEECICGEPMCEKSRKHINDYLALLPPKSYSSMYHDFTKTAALWGNGYDKEKIEGIIKRVLDNQEQAEGCDGRIRELDEIEKKSPDIEDLVVARKQAEEAIVDLEKAITEYENKLSKYKIYLQQQMKEFDKQTGEIDINKKVSVKIDIMNRVLEYYDKKLETAAEEYSKKLEINIQYLLDSMLTSKRNVSVSNEFSVRVTDSFNDESKSEGQFAVVSFAYIGGILKMLKSEENLSGKEYPLVLDGPFSKLDPDQRQNVVNVIPQFAPQVIIFSKDDLHDVFDSKNIGRVWTIVSNEEKNIARIEEGKLWK
jgi:DNA sulfur modification protein DndD